MMEIFNTADVDPDIMKYWALTPKDINDLLQLTEIKSIDYNSVRAAKEGKVENYGGFSIFWSNLFY